MIILVINCGSSSIKYQLLDMKSDDVFDVIAKGIAEKIGRPAGVLQYAPAGKETDIILAVFIVSPPFLIYISEFFGKT